MASEEHNKVLVTVTPALLEAIRDAGKFYENIADEQWLVYNRSKYRYFNPDLAVMRDKAALFRHLETELLGEPPHLSTDELAHLMLREFPRSTISRKDVNNDGE